MNTNFFQNIAGLNVPGNWKISVQTNDNEQFTVSALFTANNCGDNASKMIPPILLKGTIGELDEGFFDAITVPVQQTAGLYTNMELYLKEVERARLASKEEQERRNKEKTAQTAKKPGDVEMPDPKPSKEEKKKAYDEAMKNIASLTSAMKYADALAILPSVEDYPEKRAELEKKEAELKRLNSQYENALFNLNAE
jgi:PRTRC genetic system protein E